MRASRSLFAYLAVALAAAGWLFAGASAQTLPMAAVRDSGEPVYPVYEGWYKNADGSFTLLFGYFNRNGKQTLDVPIGPNNRVEPGGPDLGQPTHFDPKRGWGVFTVVVPKDFGTKKLTWTLSANGATNSVPAHLDPNWFIEPLEDAASKNRPPTLAFQPGGRTFEGPPRELAASFTTTVLERLAFPVFATDVKPTTNLGLRAGRERRERLDISVQKFRGPGAVAFEKNRLEVAPSEARVTVAATFGEPGEYIIRVQANDETGDGGGGFQCCWTSAHVKVTVRPAVHTTGQ
jgi:hypothetical protein